MVVPDASRSRHVAFLKQSCGFSTQVRNCICCRKAIPTTKRYIGAFRLGAARQPGWPWTLLLRPQARLPAMLSCLDLCLQGRTSKGIVISHDYPALLRYDGGVNDGRKRTSSCTSGIAGDQRASMAKPRPGMGSRAPCDAASPT